MGGFDPTPHQLSHFLTVKNEADRRYGTERYSDETRRLHDVLNNGSRCQFRARRDTDLCFRDSWLVFAARAPLDRCSRLPHVRRWYETLTACPGVQRGLAVTLSDIRVPEFSSGSAP